MLPEGHPHQNIYWAHFMIVLVIVVKSFLINVHISHSSH